MSAVPRVRSTKPAKPYWEMTTQELREATKEFDQEMLIDMFRPMSPAERREWKRLRQKPVWSKVTVRLSLDMLRRIDVLAKRWKFSRSKVVRTGLDSFLTEWLRRTENTTR